jgi:hypothetical protein
MYTSEISRTSPGAFLFLIDQSGSMHDADALTGKPLSHAVADSINKLLMDLVIKCSKSEGVRDYFHVGVIGYGLTGVNNGFKGVLEGTILNPISKIADNPLQVEDRIKKVSDGAGGIIEQNVKFPVWFQPTANGGTPMCDAYKLAAEELANWCDSHSDSFPPILINITDGESTDGNPEPIVEKIKQLGTNDGDVLVFNVHISALERNQIQFPDSEDKCPAGNGKMLFRMSSNLTPAMQSLAVEFGFEVSQTARGYCFNAGIESLIKFLEIGTRASNLR